MSFGASPEQIHSAYRREAIKWHPDKHPDQDTMERMKEINEAFSMLSNSETKIRYDREYSLYYKTTPSTSKQQYSETEEDIHDTKLRNDIKDAREKAKRSVEELLKAIRQDSNRAAKGAWNEAKSFIFATIFVSFISALIGLCSN